MLRKLRLENFKRFVRQDFDLDDTIVLAGPNNSGKSTLLQAVAVWHMAVQRWKTVRENTKASVRTGVPLTRRDFTAIPLREMDLLWHGRDTAFRKNERKGTSPGAPKPAGITAWGETGGREWVLGVRLKYQSSEQIYVSLADESGKQLASVPEGAEVNVVHVPPFSGIGAAEQRHDVGYQNLLVGQGKPGDILRNLLLEVAANERDENAWPSLVQDVADLFDGCEIRRPVYREGDPFIVVEYRDGKSRKSLDVSCAGSGLHQVLVLMGFFYARPASVLLLDEPDAHQHVILQRSVYDRLRLVARRRGCQLIVSTHSETLLDATQPTQVLSLYGTPRRLALDAERDAVREAMRMLTTRETLLAETGLNALYVEDEETLAVLEAFAKVLGHRARRLRSELICHAIRGRNPREARRHYFALKHIRPETRGLLVLDGDDRNLPDHEVAADGLEVLRWRRYEVESYLVHPAALIRFVEATGLPLQAPQAERFLARELPDVVREDPLGDHAYLQAMPASKGLLPGFFRAAGMSIGKKDYYQIAAGMLPEEVPAEVIEKLDAVARLLPEGPSTEHK